MKKYLNLIGVLCLTVFFVQCNDTSKFEITKGKVGAITTETTVKDLETIFAKDSIVKILSEGIKGSTYFQDDDEYKIYEKGGRHLLTIIPKEQLEESSTLKSIQIYDERYKTEGGINVNSTFAEINANSKLSKVVESSFTSATLFIDDIDTTISIDKEELGLKEFNLKKISLEQIPDLAKIKSFIVWFN